MVLSVGTWVFGVLIATPDFYAYLGFQELKKFVVPSFSAVEMPGCERFVLHRFLTVKSVGVQDPPGSWGRPGA